MAMHTPGVWLALPNVPQIPHYWHVSDGEDFICQMFSAHGEFENAAANARFISAAPDLFAAVKATIALLERKAQPDEGDYQKVYDLARAALAKASPALERPTAPGMGGGL